MPENGIFLQNSYYLRTLARAQDISANFASIDLNLEPSNLKHLEKLVGSALLKKYLFDFFWALGGLGSFCLKSEKYKKCHKIPQKIAMKLKF